MLVIARGWSFSLWTNGYITMGYNGITRVLTNHYPPLKKPMGGRSLPHRVLPRGHGSAATPWDGTHPQGLWRGARGFWRRLLPGLGVSPRCGVWTAKLAILVKKRRTTCIFLPAKEMKTWGILTKLTFHQQKTELQPANMIQNVGDFHWGIYFLPLEMIVFDIQQKLGWYFHLCPFMQYGWYPIYIHYIYPYIWDNHI